MLDRGFFLTLQAIRRQLAAMPYDFYLIRLIHHATLSCPRIGLTHPECM